MPIRETLKKVLPRINAVAERAHVRIEPMHYYSNVADRRWLRRHQSWWQRPLSSIGATWDLDRQLEWLSAILASSIGEVEGLGAYRSASSAGFGPGFGPIESQVLHGFVRAEPPGLILEVGSGVSTAVAAAARDRNAADGRPVTLIACIEPFARPALRAMPDIELHEVPCQAAPEELFARLGPGDLLFIDSTHAVRTGSELVRLYLDVIPSLPPGVHVHIHDIYLPYAFSPTVLDDIFDWQETVLLAALLSGNPNLIVRCCLSALHHQRSAELEALLPDYRPALTVNGLALEPPGEKHFPSSIWLQTV